MARRTAPGRRRMKQRNQSTVTPSPWCSWPSRCSLPPAGPARRSSMLAMASFRVGGGILVMLIAISTLYGQENSTRQTADEAAESVDRDSIAVVPLSIPLLAGPGGISAVIVYAHLDSSLGHYLVLALAIISIGTLALLALLAAPYISERLGKTGINIVTRIMGLILAAIAVEFIAGGLRGLFPILG